MILGWLALGYESDPISWFQKKICANMMVLTDNILKEMNELNLIQCQRILTGCLSVLQVKLCSGQLVDLILWCLPDTTKRHHQWKGLLGRLDWEGSIRILSLNPQPMGNVFILIRTGL